MACYRPLRAYRLEDGSVTFDDSKRGRGDTLDLPCGKCVGCIVERRRQWSIRLVHESKLYDFNCAVTLTYDKKNYPVGGRLEYPDFQGFMKRLREWARSRRLPKIRFFVCGEYGEQGHRPHFHAALFNFDFLDKRECGSHLYSSPTLDSLWGKGLAVIGELTPQTAAYIAGYVTKKVSGSGVTKPHSVIWTDEDTGEISEVERRAEFVRMSLRPGIGSEWLKKFYRDVYPRGKVVYAGQEQKPPRYYDRKFAATDEDGYAVLQAVRYRDAISRSGDNTSDRLAVREQVALAALATKNKRSI